MIHRVALLAILLLSTGGELAAQASAQPALIPSSLASRATSSVALLRRPAKLSVEKVSLYTALTDLQVRSGVSLVYSPSRLPLDRSVSCECFRLTVGEALERILVGTDVRYSVMDEHILIEQVDRHDDAPPQKLRPDVRVAYASFPLTPSLQQPVLRRLEGSITGRVTSAATGQPIAGAQVAVVDTRFGAVTGPDGRYSITGVPDGSYQLKASLLSFAEQARSVTIVTGQTASVDFSLVPQAVTLEGVVAVGYGTQQRKDITGSVSSISESDIEDRAVTSVEQAIQGRVPGVSITTTAGGAEPNNDFLIRGRNSIKASNAPLVVIDGIPFNGSISEINQSDIASINILKDASAAAIYGARGSNGVMLITSKRGRVGAPRLSYQGYAGIQQIAHLPRMMTGSEFADFKCVRLNQGQNCEKSLSPTELANLQAGNSTDWVDLATHTGFQQQHNLSFSGGTADTQYYIAGSLLDVNGIARNDEFQRSTLRVNLTQRVKPWLQMGTSSQLALTDRSGVPASFSDAFYMNPLTEPYTEEGDLTIYPWTEDPFFGNPLEGILATDADKGRRVFTSNYAEVDLPIEGLTFRINGGLDFSTRDDGRYYGRNTKTGFVSQGSARIEGSRRLDWTVENILRYNRQFGAHNIDITTLYSTARNQLESSSLQSEGFPNDVLTYYQAQVARSLAPAGSRTESSIVSQMGRLNYSLAGRYLLTLTARRDGYSGFGTNHKYGIFPSVALGWNVSDESFWPFQDSFDALKLRLSYGQNGNQGILPYQTLARLGERSFLDGDATAPGYLPVTLGNPDLRWETTTSLNMGADFGMLQNRIRGSLDLYAARTSDLLLDRSISAVHGISEITQNIGKTRNRGVELQLSTINVEGSDFSWNTDFNVSANRNRIVDLYGNGLNDIVNEWFIGQPVDVEYGYVYAGILQSEDDIAHSAQPGAKPGDVRIEDRNGDGKITPDDRAVLGNLQPTYAAGFNNTLRFRDLSLDFFFHAVQGVSRSNSLLNDDVFGDVRRSTALLEHWSPDHPNAVIPANRLDSNLLNVGFFENASFIRLKDVTLSYDLPPAFTPRVGVETVRLYVNGRNLWTHTDWTGLDPELSGQRSVPLERVFMAGIDVGF
jgi:TonB-linked SusC/RagA family outer membrane protein